MAAISFAETHGGDVTVAEADKRAAFVTEYSVFRVIGQTGQPRNLCKPFLIFHHTLPARALSTILGKRSAGDDKQRSELTIVIVFFTALMRCSCASVPVSVLHASLDLRQSLVHQLHGPLTMATFVR